MLSLKARLTVIKNSIFTSNQATGCNHPNSCLGGALYIEGMNTVIMIYNTDFENNTSDQNGGIVYAFYTTLTISNSYILKNSARNNGGAVNAFQVFKFTLINTIFESNEACKDGGAVYLSNLNGNATVSDCNFTQNTANSNGGAIFNDNSHTQINSSLFISSSARSNGGALFNVNFGTISALNGIFCYNNAQKDGGVIYARYLCRFIDSIFINNTAVEHGGVVYAHQLRSSYNNIIQNSYFHHNWANIG